VCGICCHIVGSFGGGESACILCRGLPSSAPCPYFPWYCATLTHFAAHCASLTIFQIFCQGSLDFCWWICFRSPGRIVCLGFGLGLICCFGGHSKHNSKNAFTSFSQSNYYYYHSHSHVTTANGLLGRTCGAVGLPIGGACPCYNNSTHESFSKFYSTIAAIPTFYTGHYHELAVMLTKSTSPSCVETGFVNCSFLGDQINYFDSNLDSPNPINSFFLNRPNPQY